MKNKRNSKKSLLWNKDNSSLLEKMNSSEDLTNFEENKQEMDKISSEIQLNIILSISQFKYKAGDKSSRIYSSSFLNIVPKGIKRESLRNTFHKLLHNLYANSLFQKLIIIDIFDDRANYSFYEAINEDYYNNSILIERVHSDKFFSSEFMEKLSGYSKHEEIPIILSFNGWNIASIKSEFKCLGINISGNNNTLKHILSPTQFSLSKFLLALYGNDPKHVNMSFTYLAKTNEIARPVFDFTNKKELAYLNRKEARLSEANSSNKLETEGIIENNLETIGDRENITYGNQISDLQKVEIKDVCDGSNNNNNNNNENEEDRENITSGNRFSGNRFSAYRLSAIQKREIHTIRSEKYTDLVKVDQDFEKTDYFLYFNKLSNIINDSSLSDLQKQELFENFLFDFGTEQNSNNEILVKKGILYDTSKVKNRLQDAENTLILAYAKLRNNNDIKKHLLDQVDLNKSAMNLILIAYSVIISYYTRLGYTAIAAQIGKIVMEFAYLKAKKKNKNEATFRTLFEENEINSVILIKIGDYLMSLLSQYPHDIFERDYSMSSKTNKEVATIKINPQHLEFVKQNLIVAPANLPMLTEPVKWSYSSYGGYLKNQNLKNDIITKNSDNDHQIKNKIKLFAAVNRLNSTKFSINTLLLDYLLNEGKFLLDNDNGNSGYDFQQDITIRMAELYSNTPFYLTVRSDWRGRLVTESFFLTYQGSDLSASLINFWKGEALTEDGKYYFYIHGANNHNSNGLSKKTWAERIKWVEDNKNKIINLDRELILSAENKFSFTSFCLNMQQIAKDPNWIVKSPVFLDATCSGIQHFAGILKDLDLAAQVNLTKDNESPADIYTYLTDPINQAINKYGEENTLYEHFKLLKLDRKMLKQPIMTKVYNVTDYGISKQVESNLKVVKFTKDENSSDIEQLYHSLKANLKNKGDIFLVEGEKGSVLLTKRDLMKIAQIINENIFIAFPSLQKIYEYFIEIVDILSDFELPIWWITPNGMKITQHYLKVVEKKASFYVFNSAKKLVLKETTDILSKARQKQGIIPNVIHSMDASHLIKVILAAKKFRYDPIITIHDCFGTHPNKMKNLENSVRIEFILMYTKEDFLTKFHKNIIKNLKDNQKRIKEDINKSVFVFSESKNEWIKLPDLPKLGKFDLNQIKESKYMIT